MKKYTRKDLKEIKFLINDFIVKNDYGFIYDHLLEFGYICELIYRSSVPYLDNMDEISSQKDYLNFPVYSGKERIDIVNKFYQEHKIDFNTDDVINRGILTSEHNTYFEEIEKQRIYRPYLGGLCTFYNEKGHVTVKVPNSGYISDCSVIIHELSHYRDQRPGDSIPISREFFTEALAYTEEYIFWKENEDKFPESKYFMQRSLSALIQDAIMMESIISIVLVFLELGDIDKESYEMYFGNSEDYEDELDVLIDTINEQNFDLIQIIDYIIALILFPYMYYSYQKDNTFMEKITNLHELVQENSFEDCLKYIGINDISFESIKKVSEFFNLLLSELYTIQKEDIKSLEQK